MAEFTELNWIMVESISINLTTSNTALSQNVFSL